MNTQSGHTTGDKLKTLAELGSLLEQARADGRQVVLCHGVFDLVHPGHIRHLEAARGEGDLLVVTITPDRFVNKGPGRPVFNQRLRAETLSALQCIDYVAINEWPTAVETIHLLQPAVYVKGKDYIERSADVTGKIHEEERAILTVGGRIHFTQDITFSSTNLLNAHFDVFPVETATYLRQFRKQYSAADVVSKLQALKRLNVLVIGDTIVDEYHFCRPYGMASKSATIAAQFINEERYAGGALAVANHLASFCDRVDLVSCLGEQDSCEAFVRQHLRPNIQAKLFFRPDAPTVTKRRYVQPFLATKLFEIAFFNDRPLPTAQAQEFCEHLLHTVPNYDLVVVADFGHGLLDATAIKIICERARYLALNVQLNSINNGYNVITKYQRADYVCIDEEEARLATYARYAPLNELVQSLAASMSCQMMTVTRGYRGSITYQPEQRFIETPVLSSEVIDTIGAGDAYLSLTAACACSNMAPELIGFVGNAVGALAVKIIGNKSAVESVPLYKFIHTLLS